MGKERETERKEESVEKRDRQYRTTKKSEGMNAVIKKYSIHHPCNKNS